ncbi:MAG TPA: electron transfer flavoprotein subunit alpha/FixB family protein [Terriglobia bacterium]|nr:electron transfer flavoprotein subunit alpha/FixB family protein [Terriglobia bacterium]
MPNEILVFAEQQDGKITRPTWEAVAAGQRIAGDTGATVSIVVLGRKSSALAPELASADVAGVLAAESSVLAEYTPDGYALAMGEVIRSRQPQYVVFSHTYQVRDFAPKLAAALGAGFISDCLSYRKRDTKLVFVRQVFQGKFNADVEFTGNPPYLVSFQAGSFREDSVKRASTAAPITTTSIEIAPDKIRARPGERFREAKQAVDLTQAEIIVAVGRGIRAPENVDLARKLAEALGGEIGASRPICDGGWLPMDRQIGSSGQTVAPKLYVALGISGAIQHQVGMKGSRSVLAINKDREAPIFEVATYGVVGDLFEVVPALIEEIQKAKSR